MRAPVCLGLDGTGTAACVNPHRQGKAANFTIPAPRWTRCYWAWFDTAAGRRRVLDIAEPNLCPYCLTDRMEAGAIHRADLNALAIGELRQCAGELGVASSGNKRAVVDRILADGPQGRVIVPARAVAMRAHFDGWNCLRVAHTGRHSHRVNTATIYAGAPTPCDADPPPVDHRGH